MNVCIFTYIFVIFCCKQIKCTNFTPMQNLTSLNLPHKNILFGDYGWFHLCQHLKLKLATFKFCTIFYKSFFNKTITIFVKFATKKHYPQKGTKTNYHKTPILSSIFCNYNAKIKPILIKFYQ